MALFIPRLEWNEISVTATRTSPSPILTAISSTTAINVGMIASGSGIPLNASVISKTVNSVTLSENVTLSGTSVITFVERIDFDFPPTQDTEEQYKPKQTITESLSGSQQVVTDYLEALREIRLGFISSTTATKLKTNFFLFAYLGNTFKYYPDKDEAEVFTYELEKRTYEQVRQVKKHPSFLYEINFKFRRVI